MKQGWLLFTELDSGMLLREPDPSIREVLVRRHVALVRSAARGTVVHVGTRGVVLSYSDGLEAVEDGVALQLIHRDQGDLPPLPGLKVVVVQTEYDVDDGVVVGDVVPLAFKALREAGPGELLIDGSVVDRWRLHGSAELAGVSRIVHLGTNSVTLHLVAWSSPRTEPLVEAYRRGQRMAIVMVIPSLVLLILAAWLVWNRRPGSVKAPVYEMPGQYAPLVTEALEGSSLASRPLRWVGEECPTPEGRRLCIVLQDGVRASVVGAWTILPDRASLLRFLTMVRESSSLEPRPLPQLCLGYEGERRKRCLLSDPLHPPHHEEHQ